MLFKDFVMWSHVFILLFIYLIKVTSTTPVTPAIYPGRLVVRTDWPEYTFYPELNGWLKLHTEATDFQDARVKCHMEDALMASTWNSKFKEAFVRFIEQNIYQSALYSGAQVAFSDGVYKYVKGVSTLTLSRSAGFDRCVVFNENNSLSEVDCGQRYPFACFAPMPTCGGNEAKYDLTCAGYTYSSETGHCYKTYTQEVNWTTAYEACRGEGAYLAVVNSQAEAQVLKNLIPFGIDFVSIGFYFWTPTKSWWTVKGQTIEDAGFSTWVFAEPAEGNVRGFLHSRGELDSLSKITTAPYICEKDPVLIVN